MTLGRHGPKTAAPKAAAPKAAMDPQTTVGPKVTAGPPMRNPRPNSIPLLFVPGINIPQANS